MKSRWLWSILIMALAVRVGLLMTAAPADPNSGVYRSDSAGYIELSRSMAQRGCFCKGPIPETFRTPGYPLFLLPAVAHEEGGAEPVDKDLSGIASWLVVQIVLDVLLVGLTYLLGRRLLSHRAGLLAALLQALCPLAIASSCRVLSDSVFAVMLTGGLLLIVRHIQSCRAAASLAGGDSPVRPLAFGWRAIATSAAIVAAASYVRPVGVLLAGVIGLILLADRKAYWRGLAWGSIFLLCILPWVWRNAVVADFVGFSSVTDEGLYDYSAPRVIEQVQGISLEQAKAQLAAAEAAAGPFPTRGAQVRYRSAQAVAIVRAHPWTYAKIHMRGDLAFWLPDAPDFLEVAGLTSGNQGALEVFHQQGVWAAAKHYFQGNTLAAVVAGPLVLIFLVRLAGLVLWLGRVNFWLARREHWLLVMVVLVCALVAGPAAHPRFRVPVEPILSIAAATGWLMLRKKDAAPTG